LGGVFAPEAVEKRIAAKEELTAQSDFWNDPAKAEKMTDAVTGDAGRNRYVPYDFIYNDMPDVLSACDIVFSRSGANTLWESAVCAKPMLLLPLPRLPFFVTQTSL